jgi:hypothetical protein
MTASAVTWGDPPADARSPRQRERGGSLTREAGELKTRPTQWAKIASRSDEDKARGLARQIVNGKLAPFADAKYEAVASGTEVWARYIGPA